MKLIYIALILLVVIVAGVIVYTNFIKPVVKGEVNQYQGPVRPTDDESYFRRTGITKSLGEKN